MENSVVQPRGERLYDIFIRNLDNAIALGLGAEFFQDFLDDLAQDYDRKEFIEAIRTANREWDLAIGVL